MLKQILSHIRQTQQADVVYGFAQHFVTMVKERNVKLLEAWLRDCQKSGISDLVTFAQGLEDAERPPPGPTRPLFVQTIVPQRMPKPST